ncbi:MAG: nucleotidyltransferase domain-containing protein [Chloroflexota bacterium]|nr:nucleotidyltransferase domain-containing protein [Chloroflexota bacterium]
MIDLVEQHLAEIRALCREYGVSRLELFGSAATDAFDTERSDVDFIVDYPPECDLGPWLSRYQELEERLGVLLGRPVDLVMARSPAMSNKWFRREADKARMVVYDALQVSEVA